MAKQQKIPGTEGKQNIEVERAAEAYVKARDKRMGETENEASARETLIAMMKKAKLNIYRDDDAEPPLLITLSTTDKVKVQVIEEEMDDEPRPRRGMSAAAASAPQDD